MPVNILSQYRASLKKPKAEEIFDLVAFRPVAFLLTLIFVRTPITPNQITGAALALATLAGVCLAVGERRWSVAGAILYAMANVLDCSDGMVARLKHNGTELGRMVDVFADVISGSAVYIGLGIGLAASGTVMPVPIWVPIVLGGLSFAAQAAMFDFERNMYLAGRASSAGNAELSAIEARIPHVSAPRRLVMRAYLGYMHLQQRLRPVAPRSSRFADHTVRLWSFVGSSTHVALFAVAVLIDNPFVLFTYTIVVGNAWAVLLVIREVLYERHARAGEARGLLILPRVLWTRR